MMKQTVIRFDEVRVGDKVYDPQYYAPNKWRAVTTVETTGRDTVALALGTSVHSWIDTRTRVCGHKGEGISVQREV